tara:strand:- start:173 stop:322 length:150 start_codon:yes stop_codon:yes gene_type:complete
MFIAIVENSLPEYGAIGLLIKCQHCSKAIELSAKNSITWDLNAKPIVTN